MAFTAPDALRAGAAAGAEGEDGDASGDLGSEACAALFSGAVSGPDASPPPKSAFNSFFRLPAIPEAILSYRPHAEWISASISPLTAFIASRARS